MAQDLKVSTSVTKRIGPAVSIADGYSPITNLDLTTTNEAIITDNDGTVIDISDGTWSWSAISGAAGMYNLTFKVTDVDEPGTLEVYIRDSDLCLPILNRFNVKSAEAYDVDYVASALSDLVNTEIVNALSTDIIAELTGDPGATPTMTDAIMLLYMTLRNLRITDKTSGDTKVHNDAGTEILKAIITDTVTTFTKAKFTIP